MRKALLIIPITIAIFFYPTTSHSNAGGSPGGKTDSPNDGASCTVCHYPGAITHKSVGKSGSNSRSWTMDWQAPNNGSGDITF